MKTNNTHRPLPSNHILILLTLLCSIVLGGRLQAQDSLKVASYEFGVFNQYDLRNSSTNAISIHRALHDAFNTGLKPLMSEKMGNTTYDIFSFAVGYMSLVWSHEFGHSFRAKQVGGRFKIHNVALPIPYTTMHLPDSINLVDEALSVTAGFEVNYLNVRTIQRRFIRQNGGSNVDLSFAMINRLMFPLYTSVIVPIDAEERDVWINTAGDPVHVTLPVFKNYADGEVFMPDGSVNPELVNYYNQSAILGSLFNLLDPQFYKEFGAAFGNTDLARKPTFLVGDHENGWTYGTLFNVSPLGYELYLNNYVHLNGRQFSIYLKYGNPFKNQGLGVIWNDMLVTDKMSISATVDVWDQDLFGRGIAAEATTILGLSEDMGLVVNTGYKSEGYVLGKQIDAGFNLGVGVRWSNSQ